LSGKQNVIYFSSPEEKLSAEQLIQELQAAFDKPMVIEVKPISTFKPAEKEHQNYYQRNANKPYCQIVIDPKLARFREGFPELILRNKWFQSLLSTRRVFNQSDVGVI
jgi:peptide-methionine (S)-S-oxide reductase